MFISRELRKKNIAEFLLYMWQVEDLLRANDLSIEKIENRVVEPYKLSPEDSAQLLEWYSNLIDMMRIEGVKDSGHLQINKNVLIMLTDLHGRLLKSPKVPFYAAAYYKALPYIVEFRNKSKGHEKPELENCFDALDYRRDACGNHRDKQIYLDALALLQRGRGGKIEPRRGRGLMARESFFLVGRHTLSVG